SSNPLSRCGTAWRSRHVAQCARRAGHGVCRAAHLEVCYAKVVGVRDRLLFVSSQRSESADFHWRHPLRTCLATSTISSPFISTSAPSAYHSTDTPSESAWLLRPCSSALNRACTSESCCCC